MARFSQFNSQKQNEKNVREEDIRQKFDTYKDMSKSQLSQTLLEEVAKQKAEGSFDYQRLESMVDSLQGMLPWQDYQNIRRLLESLK